MVTAPYRDRAPPASYLALAQEHCAKGIPDDFEGVLNNALTRVSINDRACFCSSIDLKELGRSMTYARETGSEVGALGDLAQGKAGGGGRVKTE